MDIQKNLDRLVGSLCESFDTPSLAVSVVYHGREYYSAAGFIDRKNGVKARPESIYAIASSSKAFIATALLMLAHDGVFDLNAPVKTYLPSFKMFDPYMTDHLTLKDALSHRSGLPRHDLTWLNNLDGSIYDTIKALAHVPPAFEPRTRWHYQNHMFVLATVLVDLYGGMPWQEFLKKRIFEPLGMHSTHATGETLTPGDSRNARPYRRGANGEFIEMPFRPLTCVGCCGSMHSTVIDLAKWTTFHLHGDDALLPRALLDEMHAPHMIIRDGEFSPVDLSPEVDMASYGYAWFIESYRGHKLVHHGGTTDGFKSLVAFAPGEHIGINVLTNLNRVQAPMGVTYSILDMLLGLEPVDWCRKIGAELEKQAVVERKALAELKKTLEQSGTPFDPARYAGTYVHPGYGKINLYQNGPELRFKAFRVDVPVRCLGGEQFMLDPAEPLAYFTLHKPFFFETIGQDRVCALHMYTDDQTKVPMRFVRA